MYSSDQIKKIKWGALEEVEPLSLWPVMVPGWSHIIQKTGKILGRAQKNMICIYEGNKGALFVDHDEWTALGQFALKKIIKNPKFAININRNILRLSDVLTNFTEQKIFKVDLKKKTPAQLIALYKKYEDHHGNLYAQAIVPVYLELYKPHLTKYLVEYLHQQIEKYSYGKNAKECFALLTVANEASQVQLEEQSLLRLALFASQNQKATLTVSQRLARHVKKFCYLGYNFEGPAFPDSYFEERLSQWIKRKTNITSTLNEIKHGKLQAKRVQNQIEKVLRIDSKHQTLFQITREIIYGKDYRKMSLIKAYYHIEPLLKEIARRCYLPLREVRNCSPDELLDIMNNKIERPVDLSQRLKGCLFVVLNKKLPGTIFVDNVYATMLSHLKKHEDLSEIVYFHGQTAATGKAQGVVKIINSKADLVKMNVGDILVSQMTNPDLVPAMKKAAAIITDHGGVTCHAAIVSRELRIPCVIGTKIATKVFKDGDIAEVDATTGTVRKIT